MVPTAQNEGEIMSYGDRDASSPENANPTGTEPFNVPDGANECSIHYFTAFCDCPPGT